MNTCKQWNVSIYFWWTMDLISLIHGPHIYILGEVGTKPLVPMWLLLDVCIKDAFVCHITSIQWIHVSNEMWVFILGGPWTTYLSYMHHIYILGEVGTKPLVPMWLLLDVCIMDAFFCHITSVEWILVSHQMWVFILVGSWTSNIFNLLSLCIFMIFISSYVMHITNLKWVTLCYHHHLFHAYNHRDFSYLCMHIHDNVCYCVWERESERVRVNENCLICLQGKWEQVWICRGKKKSWGGVKVHEAWCNCNQ